MNSIELEDIDLFDGENIFSHKTIVIKKEKIFDIRSSAKKKAVSQGRDYSGCLVVPGFIDLQINGGGGILFNETPTCKTLEILNNTHVKFGTTAFLPTFITDSETQMKKALKSVKKYLKDKKPGVIGLHLEGPFINEEKQGIHDIRSIRSLTKKDVDLLSSFSGGVLLMTIAPEKTDFNLLQRLVEKNVILFAGHSNATFEQMNLFLQSGISGVTHLFNACSQLGSREPGIVGAALLDKNAWCSFIADGLHVHKASLDLAFKIKEKKKCLLVSDAMSPVGTDLKSFFLKEKKIQVKENRYTDEQGTLAGSSLTMHAAFCYVLQNRLVSLTEALRMASTNVAECLKIDGTGPSRARKGRILPDFDSDLLILDKKNYAVINIVQNGIFKK